MPSSQGTESLLFVTVGTTRFDALVAAVTNPEFVESLRGLGFTHVTIQHGSSPVNLLSISDINVELFDYAPSIASYLERADAVITHAGAGSLLESIRNGCKAIAVPNASLMHNHQNELAQKLASEGLCVCAEPDTHELLDLLRYREVNALSRIATDKWMRGRDPLDGSRAVMGVLEEEAFC